MRNTSEPSQVRQNKSSLLDWFVSGLGRAGFASSARWPGEGLGDVEPFLGIATVRDQAEVGAVPALGDEQAEVERRAGDRLRRALAPDPDRAVGGGEFDPERFGGRPSIAYQVGEVARAHPDVGHMAQP